MRNRERNLQIEATEDLYLNDPELFEGRFASRADIRALPWVLTKDDLRRLYPFGLCKVDRADIYEYHESFGTTGRPTAGFFTRCDLDDAVAELALSPVNLRRGDMVLVRFPYAISLPAHIFQRFVQDSGASVIPCSSRSFVSPYPRVTRMIQELGATVLCCMPTEAILLAQFGIHEGRDIRRDFSGIRALCVAGEDLQPGMRRYLRELWQVPVYDFYGATEAGNVAFSCEHENLHLANQYFHADFLPAACGAHELILTTLGKQGLPLLKYRTEDLVILGNQACPCGRSSQTLRVLGRYCDVQTINQVVFHPGQIKDAVFQLCAEHKLPPFWRAALDGDHILLRMEENPDPQASASLLSARLSLPIKVESVAKGTIQSLKDLELVVPVGKPRYFAL